MNIADNQLVTYSIHYQNHQANFLPSLNSLNLLVVLATCCNHHSLISEKI